MCNQNIIVDLLYTNRVSISKLFFGKKTKQCKTILQVYWPFNTQKLNSWHMVHRQIVYLKVNKIMYSDSRIPDNLIVDSLQVVSQLMGIFFF